MSEVFFPPLSLLQLQSFSNLLSSRRNNAVTGPTFNDVGGRTGFVGFADKEDESAVFDVLKPGVL